MVISGLDLRQSESMAQEMRVIGEIDSCQTVDWE